MGTHVRVIKVEPRTERSFTASESRQNGAPRSVERSGSAQTQD